MLHGLKPLPVEICQRRLMGEERVGSYRLNEDTEDGNVVPGAVGLA